jgi:phosphoglucomutase/phosphomannomutase
MTTQQTALAQVEKAAAEGKLSAGAVTNLRVWLTDLRYADYASKVMEHINAGKWKQLDDVFWTIIPFGTGGRRGKIYPIGTNAINDRTIGESAQGLADYVKEFSPGQALSCALAYDTRHYSRHFAQLCAEVMVAAGYKVYFLDGFRSTPELSFAVRFKQCSCGIMVTASHNPPSDNAVKAYWSTGGQLLPPHDEGVIERVMNVKEIRRADFNEAMAAGQIVYCQEEVDAAFIAAVTSQSFPGPRDLKIIYSPLHGVGASAVCPALAGAGFRDVEVFGPHAAPDPDFTNVPGHVSNPENPAVFKSIIERGKAVGADLIVATDPDCDRVGVATPITRQPDAPWTTLTGNQIGSLLADYLLGQLRAAGKLTPEHYIVKTLVTTELMRRIADAYGVRTVGDLLVGFKWIGGAMDEYGPEKFVLGAEESYGFLVGTHARDKDAAVASMLLAEIAARAKAQGQTLQQKLDELFRRYGCHAEKQLSLTMPGAEGMAQMNALMAGLRKEPPAMIGGLKVTQVRDYLTQTIILPDGTRRPLAGPKGDLVMLDLAPEGNYAAVRPSGTEPKVKFYMFAREAASPNADLEAAKQSLVDRLAAMEKDFCRIAAV